MSALLFSNNATSTLAGAITNTSLSAVLSAGSGVLFPAPSAGQYFVLTFVDAATGLLNEVVHVTNVTGDTITIVRAQEGTTAKAWIAGDIASNLCTAGTMQALAQTTDLGPAADLGIGAGLVNDGSGNLKAVSALSSISAPATTTHTIVATDNGTVFTSASAGAVFTLTLSNTLPLSARIACLRVTNGFSISIPSGITVQGQGGTFTNQTISLAANNYETMVLSYDSTNLFLIENCSPNTLSSLGIAAFATAGANTNITSLATPTVTAPARYDNSSRIVSSAFVALAAPHVEGFYKNLKISGSPGATSIAYSADSVVLMTTSFILTDGGLSGTINLGSSGVINGLDTGTLTGNSPYYIWAVSNGTTFGAVASLSATAPNAAITGTYPFVAYIGSFRTGTSGILGFVQSGARTRYVASSTQTLPLLGAGDSSGVFRACSVSSIIPPSAQIISVQLSGALSSGSSTGAAPNNAISFGSTADFPYLLISNTGFSVDADWVLETSNVYIASTGSTSGSLYCLGYIDGKL